ncbi:hypothetical protein J8L73_01150 [Pseudoalteromonas sp. MMG006]|uniref:hypothetical protein n=1 Tax=Pseudoalteromonas TaxID=53246 RepID=UPI000F755489|nr:MULTISPECIES: hypothetical protein [Pseudoalteromonas]KAA8596949.1 hypothetical protein F0Z19_4349 [Vibrio cyclitrophicus]AZN33530.1 hypothetical protein EJ103_12730 [Pseudoalteromonas sp. Xi13]MBQ4797757.1 hypothetical protein [Pseudoalteromonas sp. MMG006]MBQ4857034.1 hypothetical protein [Pseudoalteromonas sp. MMG007]MCQ8820750.1 hypothetical protein [Pseudoalteromonas agarivorans]
MKFEMSITDNFASFFDEQKERYIFIDSFDNKTFEVQVGDLDNPKSVGSVLASNNDELNVKLLALYNKY